MGARLRAMHAAGLPAPHYSGIGLPLTATAAEWQALDTLGPDLFWRWAEWGWDSGRDPINV